MFTKIIEEEEGNYLFWQLISYILGLSIYFSLSYEPKLNLLLISAILVILSLILSKQYKLLKLALLFFLLGILIPSLKTIYIEKKHSQFADKKFYILEGEIESILPADKGNNLIIKNKNFRAKIRVRSQLNGAEVGDEVEVSSILYKPSSGIVPGGYNFSRKAFFEGISAVGYSVSQIEIIKKSEQNLLASYRFHTINKILQLLGPDIGGMASALIIGEYGSMNRNLLEDFRIAGISHILSVSGMHLSLVAGIFFLLTRKILLLTNINLFRYHGKKISSIFAIICSFIYLAISGFKVAAIRAFIMSGLFFLAIIFGKQVLNLRTLSLTSFTILFIWPENIVSPSFQMSFLAVLSIILCFKSISQVEFLQYQNPVIKYFILLLITSLVASIGTSLIIALSFNNFAPYSILVNFVAVPITGFYLMPLVVAFFIAQIFSLENYVLYLMKPAINFIITSAQAIKLLPGHKVLISQLDSFYVYSFIILIIIYFHAQTKTIRIFALSFSLFCIFFFSLDKPEMIVNEKSRCAVKMIDGKLYSYPKKVPSWLKRNYLNFYGQKTLYYNEKLFFLSDIKEIDSFCSDCNRPWGRTDD